MPLTAAQVERFSRQIILPEVGGIGQERLLAARVRLLGRGAAVGWAARYLAAAGVGGLVVAESAEIDTAELLDAGTRLAASIDGPPDVVAALGVPADPALLLEDWSRGATAVLAAAAGSGAEIAVLCAARIESACPVCALAALGGGSGEASARAGLTAGLAAPLVGTLAATEVLLALLGAGAPRAGRRLRFGTSPAEAVGAPLVCSPGCRTRRLHGVVAGDA